MTFLANMKDFNYHGDFRYQKLYNFNFGYPKTFLDFKQNLLLYEELLW